MKIKYIVSGGTSPIIIMLCWEKYHFFKFACKESVDFLQPLHLQLKVNQEKHSFIVNIESFPPSPHFPL